jgi:hypothetical protein
LLSDASAAITGVSPDSRDVQAELTNPDGLPETCGRILVFPYAFGIHGSENCLYKSFLHLILHATFSFNGPSILSAFFQRD